MFAHSRSTVCAGPVLSLQPIAAHHCGRAAISEVSEEEFIADLIAFLSHRRGRYIDRSKFPDAVLNGMVLDLFGLYKEVVTRGGFRWAAGFFGNSPGCTL